MTIATPVLSRYVKRRCLASVAILVEGIGVVDGVGPASSLLHCRADAVQVAGGAKDLSLICCLQLLQGRFQPLNQ